MNKLTPEYVNNGTHDCLNEEEVKIIINNLDKEGFKIFKQIEFIKPFSVNDGESFDTWRLDEAALYYHYTELMTQLVLWIKNRIEETKNIPKIKDIVAEGLIEDGKNKVEKIIKQNKKFKDSVKKKHPYLSEKISISRDELKKLWMSLEKSIGA